MEKGFLTLLFSVLFCLQISAQNYTPLDFSNQQVWYTQAVHIDPNTAFPAFFDHFYGQFGGDTTWSTKVFHKYYYKQYRNAEEIGISYVGALREEGHKIYFLHRDSVAEALLYDFDHMNVGDQLPRWKWILDADSVLIIKEVTVITLMDGTTRTAYTLGIPNASFYVGSIIEGIGSTWGLIPARYFAPGFVYDGGALLAQVCKNHLPLLQQHTLGQNPPNGNWCNTFVAVKEVQEDKVGFKIYPNPFLDQIHFQFAADEKYTVSLYNTLGQLLIQKSISAGGAEIHSLETARLVPGGYSVMVQSGEGIMRFKIIKG